MGAYKMFVILKDIFLDVMPGRDKFYKIINENGLMLKPERRRHTTNSNHNYHKYKNLINNGSLKFEITAKRLYAASQRVL